jgi:ribonuclease P/MRP protein subunit POP5
MPERRPNILSSSLRYKKRYIAYKIICDKDMEFSELSNAMWHSILDYLGEKFAAEARVWILKSTFDPKTRTGLIRTSHIGTENVRAALSFVQKVKDEKVIVQVLGVSGTIKAANQKFFGHRDLRSFS